MDDKTFRAWARREYGLTEWSSAHQWKKAWMQWQLLDQMYVQGLYAQGL